MRVVDVTGVGKRYGDVVALDDVDLEVHKGEVFGILGLNGAGKTTLVECIEGLRRPDRGRIAVLGLDPRRDQDRLRQQLGVQLQDSRTPGRLRVIEAVRLYRSFYRDGENPDHLLHALGLADKRSSSVEDLSGGQQQRLCIARALANQPDVLLLDEPASALDPISTAKIEETLLQLKERYTIVIVTHNLQQAARIADFTAFFMLGELVEVSDTTTMFTKPEQTLTEEYVTGRFG